MIRTSNSAKFSRPFKTAFNILNDPSLKALLQLCSSKKKPRLSKKTKNQLKLKLKLIQKNQRIIEKESGEIPDIKQIIEILNNKTEALSAFLNTDDETLSDLFNERHSSPDDTGVHLPETLLNEIKGYQNLKKSSLLCDNGIQLCERELELLDYYMTLLQSWFTLDDTVSTRYRHNNDIPALLAEQKTKTKAEQRKYRFSENTSQ